MSWKKITKNSFSVRPFLSKTSSSRVRQTWYHWTSMPFSDKKTPREWICPPPTNVSLDFKELQDSVRAAEVTLRAEAKRSIGSLANGVERQHMDGTIGIIWNWSQPKSTALSFFVWFYMVFMFSWNLNQGILYWNKLTTIKHDIFESLLFWCDFRRKKQRFLASRKC